MLRWVLEVDDGWLDRLWVRRLLRSAAWSVAAIAVAYTAVVAALAARSQSSFVSDDVAQVVATRSWQRSGISTYFAGSNAYQLRFPLVDLVDAHWATGRQQLYVLTGVLVAACAVLLVGAVTASARGVVAGVALLAAAWVVSNPGVQDAIARPTVRNIELGGTALCLVALDALGGWRWRWRWLTLPPAAVLVAFLLWNDAYFTFVVTVPAVGVALVGAALSRSLWRLGIAVTMTIGAVGSRLLDRLGLYHTDPLQVPFRLPEDAEQERAKLALFKQLPFALRSDVSGGASPEMASANRAVVVLLCVCGALTLVWCARRWRQLPAGSVTAALLVVLPCVAWYASSNALTDGRSWRYVMMTPFVLPILLVPAAKALPAPGRTVFLLVAAVLIGRSLLINLEDGRERAGCGLDGTCVPRSAEDQDRQDQAYANWLENSSVEKVLVPYWHSNITAYLSDERVPVVTADCRERVLVTWRWLTTEARITAPASETHLVLEGGTLAGCTAADIRRQIGPPDEVTSFADYQLWRYPGDLAERLPTRVG